MPSSYQVVLWKQESFPVRGQPYKAQTFADGPKLRSQQLGQTQRGCGEEFWLSEQFWSNISLSL
jgi:hypothetical protein